MKHADHTAAFQGHRRLCDRGLLLRPAILVLPWLIFAVSNLLGQQKPTDYQIKAAYLYNFGRFIEWPSKAGAARNDSFTVCILGEDPFGSTLDNTLAGQTISGKKVVTKRISIPQDSANCQILFLGATEADRVDKVIEALNQDAVLTVSDMPQFSQRGGMIQFVLEGSRVRFEVNLTATQHAGLSLSSELLRVATVVRRNSAGRD